MNKVIHSPSLILASESKSRQQILQSVRIPFESISSGVDESPTKRLGEQKGWSAEQTALALAQEKAEKVSLAHLDRYVIGADQIMVCEGRNFDKAISFEDAKDQLRFMQGKTHQLVSACVIYLGGQEIWSVIVCPEMTVRSLSDTFIEYYVSELGDEILRSAGCYQVEGMGAQLFDKIDGDVFTIMGLPLLPLMEKLRQLGVLIA